MNYFTDLEYCQQYLGKTIANIVADATNAVVFEFTDGTAMHLSAHPPSQERVKCSDCWKDWGHSFCATCRGVGYLVKHRGPEIIVNRVDVPVQVTGERRVHRVATPTRCPRCDSPDPGRHPAVQFEGEVQLCEHPWHSPTADEIRATYKR